MLSITLLVETYLIGYMFINFFKTGAMITKLAYHRFKTLVLYDCPV